DVAAIAGNIEDGLGASEPHRPAALALHQPSIKLAGNLPLALAKHMIDRGTDRSEPAGHLAFRRTGGESSGEFLGNEAGRQVALAPARMMHQRRQERDVVTDAVDIKSIERAGLRLDRGSAR